MMTMNTQPHITAAPRADGLFTVLKDGTQIGTAREVTIDYCPALDRDQVTAWTPARDPFWEAFQLEAADVMTPELADAELHGVGF